MNNFAVLTPRTIDHACETMRRPPVRLAILKAGGMDVLDHLKEGLIEPDLIVNLRALREPSLRAIRSGTIGALATLSEIASNAVVRSEAPVLSQAVEWAATPQVRNVATAAGSLLQRPRCWYYRNDQFDCLKKGGSVCFAVEGENRYHAIFTDGACHMVHPSNLAVGLLVCDGAVEIAGSDRKQVAVGDLFHGPGSDIKSEHILKDGEIITSIRYSPAATSGFYAIKEKQSFDWPLVMAAASLVMDGTTIRSSRIAVGAVAPVPLRLPAVEAALAGIDVSDHDEDRLRSACARATEGAKSLRDNDYKRTLLPVAVRRAILRAAGRLTHE